MAEQKSSEVTEQKRLNEAREAGTPGRNGALPERAAAGGGICDEQQRLCFALALGVEKVRTGKQ